VLPLVIVMNPLLLTAVQAQSLKLGVTFTVLGAASGLQFAALGAQLESASSDCLVDRDRLPGNRQGTAQRRHVCVARNRELNLAVARDVAAGSDRDETVITNRCPRRSQCRRALMLTVFFPPLAVKVTVVAFSVNVHSPAAAAPAWFNRERLSRKSSSYQ
jgi:hypothetical protein